MNPEGITDEKVWERLKESIARIREVQMERDAFLLRVCEEILVSITDEPGMSSDAFFGISVNVSRLYLLAGEVDTAEWMRRKMTAPDNPDPEYN